MIAHSLDELIIAVTELSARVAAIDGHAPVLQNPEAPAHIDDNNSFRDEMHAALAAVVAKINEMESRPVAVAEYAPATVAPAVSIDLSPFENRLAAIEAAVRELKIARESTPLVPVAMPVSMPEFDARIEALEQHAVAQSELSNALQLCLTMARESEARTARLEAEARDTHKTIATVLPALAAIAGR